MVAPPSRRAGPPAMIAAATLPHGYGQGALAARGGRRPAGPASSVRASGRCWPGPARSRRRTASRRDRSPARRRRWTIAAPRDQIPRVQRPLPVAVEPAGGDEAEIERRRAEPPRPLRRRRERRPLGEVGLHGVARVRKAGDQQRAPQAIGAPTARSACRSRSSRRPLDRAGERPAERRRLDDAQHRPPSIAQADRHREERQPVREVGGAVERIDVPDARRRRVAAGGRPLLRHDAIVGERRRQPLDDQRLRALVVLGDEVDVLGLEADGGARPQPLASGSSRPRARSRRRSRASSQRSRAARRSCGPPLTAPFASRWRSSNAPARTRRWRRSRRRRPCGRPPGSRASRRSSPARRR